MKRLFINLIQEEQGVTAIEYGLIIGLIALLVVASTYSIGLTLSGTFQTIAEVAR
jgi:pilus assembly protein Flp/PilA